MTQVFISHSSKDDAEVDALADWLAAEGVGDLFVDHRDIPPGASWDNELPRQAKLSEVFVLFVTQSWLNSEECYAEYRSAYYGGKAVVPIIVGDPVTGGSDEAAARFKTLAASVQGVQVATFPFDPVSSAMLVGAIDAASKKAVWDKRRRVIKRVLLSAGAIALVLAGLGVTYRDYVFRELEKWRISSSFQSIASDELSNLAEEGRGAEFSECDNAAVCPTMVILPAGQFVMGASDEFLANDWELPATDVTIPAFAVSKFEITLSQWSTCNAFTQLEEGTAKCKELPTSQATANHPVASVSWNDAQSYVAWLNLRVSGSSEGP